MATKIAVIGLGKIAQDQHIPSINASSSWELAATVSRSTSVEGVENYSTLTELLLARPDIPVVSLCMPPAPRFALALEALNAGKHVMLEKPPGATLSECTQLQDRAAVLGLTLFTTWHSREAPRVDLAKQWLADKQIESFEINWKEDVRHWHPGQEWIWEPGGLGVFDPGINALSIVTKILPEPIRVLSADLSFPANRQTPIAVEMVMSTLTQEGGNAANGKAYFDFDWSREKGELWEIKVTTKQGVIELKQGGAELYIDGNLQGVGDENFTLNSEYPRLYQAMHQLVERQQSDVDLRPLQLVADALMLGSRQQVEPFEY